MTRSAAASPRPRSDVPRGGRDGEKIATSSIPETELTFPSAARVVTQPPRHHISSPTVTVDEPQRPTGIGAMRRHRPLRSAKVSVSSGPAGVAG